MGRRLDLTKAVRESDKKDQAEPILADVEQYAAIEATANSEGGKIIIAGLEKDALDAIDSICSGYKTKPHAELQAQAAKLEANLTLLRTLKRAGTNKSLARAALDEILGQ